MACVVENALVILNVLLKKFKILFSWGKTSFVSKWHFGSSWTRKWVNNNSVSKTQAECYLRLILSFSRYDNGRNAVIVDSCSVKGMKGNITWVYAGKNKNIRVLEEEEQLLWCFFFFLRFWNTDSHCKFWHTGFWTCLWK